ncbi:MAG: DUF1801 domain-containing protein [Saprospiraceae bacterium]
MKIKLNPDVSSFLDDKELPLRQEIEVLRQLLVKTEWGLNENIKWNGPNYSYRNTDCITMKIFPPKNIQLIFHRGVKVLEMPAQHLIDDSSGLMSWKTNDRAVVTFTNLEEIKENLDALTIIIHSWISKI